MSGPVDILKLIYILRYLRYRFFHLIFLVIEAAFQRRVEANLEGRKEYSETAQENHNDHLLCRSNCASSLGGRTPITLIATPAP